MVTISLLVPEWLRRTLQQRDEVQRWKWRAMELVCSKLNDSYPRSVLSAMDGSMSNWGFQRPPSSRFNFCKLKNDGVKWLRKLLPSLVLIICTISVGLIASMIWASNEIPKPGTISKLFNVLHVNYCISNKRILYVPLTKPIVFMIHGMSLYLAQWQKLTNFFTLSEYSLEHDSTLISPRYIHLE